MRSAFDLPAAVLSPPASTSGGPGRVERPCGRAPAQAAMHEAGARGAHEEAHGDAVEERTREPAAGTVAVADPVRLRRAVDAQYDFLWRSLRRFGVPSEAVDDALQQVFVIASSKLGAVAAEHERAYLFQIALRVAANARRKASRVREEPMSDALDMRADEGLSQDDLLDAARARALLDEALDRLPDDLRVVLVLIELEGCSAPEIAELLGIPIGTVASRLRRARDEFAAIAKRMRAAQRPRGGKP